MPVTATLPPFLNRPGLSGLREKVEAALTSHFDECVALRSSLSKLVPHLSADLGYPTKKLAVLERALLRELEAGRVDADELHSLIQWLEGHINLQASLRLARAC